MNCVYYAFLVLYQAFQRATVLGRAAVELSEPWTSNRYRHSADTSDQCTLLNSKELFRGEAFVFEGQTLYETCRCSGPTTEPITWTVNDTAMPANYGDLSPFIDNEDRATSIITIANITVSHSGIVCCQQGSSSRACIAVHVKRRVASPKLSVTLEKNVIFRNSARVDTASVVVHCAVVAYGKYTLDTGIMFFLVNSTVDPYAYDLRPQTTTVVINGTKVWIRTYSFSEHVNRRSSVGCQWRDSEGSILTAQIQVEPMVLPTNKTTVKTINETKDEPTSEQDTNEEHGTNGQSNKVIIGTVVTVFVVIAFVILVGKKKCSAEERNLNEPDHTLEFPEKGRAQEQTGVESLQERSNTDALGEEHETQITTGRQQNSLLCVYNIADGQDASNPIQGRWHTEVQKEQYELQTTERCQGSLLSSAVSQAKTRCMPAVDAPAEEIRFSGSPEQNNRTTDRHSLPSPLAPVTVLPRARAGTASLKSQNNCKPWGNKILDENAIQFIGPHIGRYRKIARALGFTEGQIQNLTEDYSKNNEEQGIQMLHKWVRRDGSEATLGKLVSAANTAERKDVACLVHKFAAE